MHGRGQGRGRAGVLAGAIPLAAAALSAAALVTLCPRGTSAGGGITPGLAMAGVPLTADAAVVGRILGRPTDELRDPSNRLIYIQRWELLCLGARYTPKGELLALDVWFDLGAVCGSVDDQYSVEGAGTVPVSFHSGREDVKRAFGYRPERVLRSPRFAILVYESAGVAFYIREGGARNGLVDAITVFPRESSTSVWAPESWGHR